MDIPNNCWECKHNKNCRSYYGGSLCKHKDDIYHKATTYLHTNDKEEK